MDTKTVGMEISASAIGTALAYLGFTNYTDTKDVENEINTKNDISFIKMNLLTSRKNLMRTQMFKI